MEALVVKLKRSDRIAGFYRFYKRLKVKYFYRLKNVHPTFNIGGKSKISKDLIAGEYSYIGFGCLIYPGVTIGRYTMLAQNVQILGADHNYDLAGVPCTFSGRPILKKTFIGRDVWVGANVIIMAGIKIGDGCIVASGSVVTKDIPPFSIVGGVPAKLIKMRFENENDIEKHIEMLNGPLLKNRRNKPIEVNNQFSN